MKLIDDIETGVFTEAIKMRATLAGYGALLMVAGAVTGAQQLIEGLYTEQNLSSEEQGE